MNNSIIPIKLRLHGDKSKEDRSQIPQLSERR